MSEVVTCPSPLRSALQFERQPKSPSKMRASDTVTVPSPSRSGGQSLGPGSPPPSALQRPEMVQEALNWAPEDLAIPIEKVHLP